MLDLRIAATSAVARPESVRKASYTVSEFAGRGRRRVYGWLTAVGVATFMVSAVIARSGRVGGAEAWVFRAINDLPGGLYPIASVAQQAGNLAAAFVVAGVALALRRWRLAVCVLVASVSKLGIERLIKLVVVRERPGTTVPGAILAATFRSVGELRVWSRDHRDHARGDPVLRVAAMVAHGAAGARAWRGGVADVRRGSQPDRRRWRSRRRARHGRNVQPVDRSARRSEGRAE